MTSAPCPQLHLSKALHPTPFTNRRRNDPVQEEDAQNHNCLHSWWSGTRCSSLTLTLKLQFFISLQPTFKVTIELFIWVGRWKRLTSEGVLPPWIFPALTKVCGQPGFSAARAESRHLSLSPGDDSIALISEPANWMLILTNVPGLLYSEEHLIFSLFKILFCSLQWSTWVLSSAKFLSSPPAFPANTCGDLKAELCLLLQLWK